MTDPPRQPRRQPGSPEDLRQAVANLAEQTQQLRSDLVVELRDLGDRVAVETRSEIERMTELAHGELRVARRGLTEHGQDAADQLRAIGSALDSRIVTMAIIGHTLVIVSLAALLVVLQ